MDTALVVLIGLFVGAIAVAFYMDWLGLWVSKEELAKEIARSKESSHRPDQPVVMGPCEKGAIVAAAIDATHSRVA